jgi:hypothetical protein
MHALKTNMSTILLFPNTRADVNSLEKTVVFDGEVSLNTEGYVTAKDGSQLQATQEQLTQTRNFLFTFHSKKKRDLGSMFERLQNGTESDCLETLKQRIAFQYPTAILYLTAKPFVL